LKIFFTYRRDRLTAAWLEGGDPMKTQTDVKAGARGEIIEIG